MTLIPDERHDETAEAVDEQVPLAGASRRPSRGRRCRARRAGMSATMTSALKMTAERMALSGVVRCITSSAPSAG